LKNFVEISDKFLSSQHLPASIIDLAISRGVNPQKLVRGTGIFFEDLNKPDALFSPAQVLKLIERSQYLIPGHDASFLLGQRLIPSQLGPLSQALNHAKNISDYLQILGTYQARYNPFIRFSAYKQDGYLHIQFSDIMGCGEHYPFLLEVLLTALHSGIKYLAEKRIQMRYQFKQKRPRHIQEYEENLGFRVAFEHPTDQLSIKLEDLNIRFRNYSPLSRAQAIHELKQDRRLNRIKPTFIQAVTELQLKNQSMNQESCAQHMGLSTATFKRKLKQHHLRYLEIQDLCFKQNTIRLLNHNNSTNEQLASQLGFNDIANFRRAFKRWFNMTPSEFKARYQP